MTRYYLTLLLVGQLLINDNLYAFVQSPTQEQPRSGKLVKQSNLFKHADQQSEVISVLKAQGNIKVKSRQRAWYFISSKKSSENSSTDPAINKKGYMPLYGWVSMLNVRFLVQAKRKGELGLSKAFSSMSKSSLPTVSTGVRGFDEDDLKKSQADLKQIELLHAFSVSKKSAKAFAQAGNLVSQNVNKD